MNSEIWNECGISRNDLVEVRFIVKCLKLALAAPELGWQSDETWCYHDDRVARLYAQSAEVFSLLQEAVAPWHKHRRSLHADIVDAIPSAMETFVEALIATCVGGAPKHSRVFRRELASAIVGVQRLACQLGVSIALGGPSGPPK